ncbi:MAG: hypothetical protein AAF358_18100 [Pseudomonadota bacterium]
MQYPYDNSERVSSAKYGHTNTRSVVRMRIFDATFFAACALIHATAWSCGARPETTAEAYAAVQDVALVRITGVWFEEHIKEFDLRAQFELVESFKGNLGERGEISHAFASHSLLLVPGVYYLLYLYPGHSVSFCTGSTSVPMTPDEVPEHYQAIFRELRILSKVEPISLQTSLEGKERKPFWASRIRNLRPHAGEVVIHDLVDGVMSGEATYTVALYSYLNGHHGDKNHWQYLVAFSGVYRIGPVQVAGGRQRFEELEITNRTAILKGLRHHRDDPMCCPTVPISIRYQINNGTLVALGSDLSETEQQ